MTNQRPKRQPNPPPTPAEVYSQRLEGVLIPHVCRACGGRVMKLSGPYMSPGGDPAFRCCNCSAFGYGSAESVCWCGFNHRSQPDHYPYQCMPVKTAEDPERPWLKYALQGAGIALDGRQEIGVISVALAKEYEQRWKDKQDRHAGDKQ